MTWPRFACTLALAVLSGSILAAQDAPVARAPKLFALLLADTDSNLGPDAEKDRDNLRRILTEGFATRPYRLELTILEGPKATAGNVFAYLRTIKGKVGPKDSVLFYSSSHGATLPQKGGHFLTLHNDLAAGQDGLSRAVLRKEMIALNSRMCVILTDCCSTVPESSRGEPYQVPPKASWPVMDLLFFHHQGMVDINGCQENSSSWTYTDRSGTARGGTFTLALVPLLCERKERFKEVFGSTDGFVTWDQFSRRLRKETDRWYQQMRRGVMRDKSPGVSRSQEKMRKQNIQDPQVISLAQKAPQFIRDKTWLFGVQHANADKKGRPGAVIRRVYLDTPASRAGFQKDDLLLAVDGQPVASAPEFDKAVQQSDGKVTVEYVRGGNKGQKVVQLKPVKPPKS